MEFRQRRSQHLDQLLARVAKQRAQSRLGRCCRWSATASDIERKVSLPQNGRLVATEWLIDIPTMIEQHRKGFVTSGFCCCLDRI